MKKKIRFPLVMDNDIEVRSIEELRKHFSIEKVIMYILDGRLIVWLRDRQINDIATSIETLNIEKVDSIKKIYDLFDINYKKGEYVDINKIKSKYRKIELLKEYTNDKKYMEVIDDIAFNQDDMDKLLNSGKTTIYLCGKEFNIPLSKKGITYIGVNKPIVVIDSNESVDWEENKISFQNTEYDEKYQQIINSRPWGIFRAISKEIQTIQSIETMHKRIIEEINKDK